MAICHSLITLFVLYSFWISSSVAACKYGIGDSSSSADYEKSLNYTLMFADEFNDEQVKNELNEQYIDNQGLFIINISTINEWLASTCLLVQDCDDGLCAMSFINYKNGTGYYLNIETNNIDCTQGHLQYNQAYVLWATWGVNASKDFQGDVIQDLTDWTFMDEDGIPIQVQHQPGIYKKCTDD